jgi:hypothetical protein
MHGDDERIPVPSFTDGVVIAAALMTAVARGS